jgi:hypothetical protein
LVRLVALNLTVLNRFIAKRLIELHRLVGTGTLLILRGLCAEPEVDITLEGIPVLLQVF